MLGLVVWLIIIWVITAAIMPWYFFPVLVISCVLVELLRMDGHKELIKWIKKKKQGRT